MSDEEPKKGEVKKFRAPEDTPVGKFEKVIDSWFITRQTAVESGSSEEFERVKQKLLEGLTQYAQNLRNPRILRSMADEFVRRRDAWQERAAAAAMDEYKEANAAVAARYDELVRAVRHFLPLPGAKD